MLQRFPAEGGDARAPPHVAAVRGAAELRRARHVAGAWQGSGHHARESGLVEVRLQAGAVGARQAVGQAHGVGWGARRQAALRQGLRHGLLPAQGRRQGQLRHPRHGGRGPARVVGVEGTQAVAHGCRGGGGGGRELGQAGRGQQRAGGAEHVGGLLALLPLGPSVLEPDLLGSAVAAEEGKEKRGPMKEKRRPG